MKDCDCLVETEKHNQLLFGWIHTGLLGDEILFKHSRCCWFTSGSLLSDLMGLIVILRAFAVYFYLYIRARMCVWVWRPLLVWLLIRSRNKDLFGCKLVKGIDENQCSRTVISQLNWACMNHTGVINQKESVLHVVYECFSELVQLHFVSIFLFYCVYENSIWIPLIMSEMSSAEKISPSRTANALKWKYAQDRMKKKTTAANERRKKLI